MSEPLAVIDTATAGGTVRFHVSLNVDDLSRSVAFFTVLFDRPAARVERDFAKFELDEPPLVLSLEPNRVPLAGKLNHLGFRLPNAEALITLQRRLELAGIATTREDGVECCYSRQTKFWVNDPDGNLWELYVLEEDGPACDSNESHIAVEPATTVVQPSAPAPAVWAHRLGEPFPPRIFVETEGADEVLLQGTFHVRRPASEAGWLLAEVRRILKPGGRVSVHQLTATEAIEELTQPLPGPAAAIETVPTAAALISDLDAAGFIEIALEKLADKPSFVVGGIECRETRIVARKPAVRSLGPLRKVLFKGPGRQIELDGGQTFRRGEWSDVDPNTWGRLRATFGDEFAFAE